MRRNILVFSILILVVFLFTPPLAVLSQSGVTWSEPVNISDMETDSAYPTVVADQSGVVHVFWAENLPEYGDFNNIIYYSRLEGEVRSQPVDILTSPQGLLAMADKPAVVIGSDGKIHLVFVGGFNGQIYYSYSYVGQAMSARSWSEPRLLSSEAANCSGPAIAIDSDGIIHVVYPIQLGSWQGIYHVLSKNNGDSWSSPELISGTALGSTTILDDVRMAISQDGIIHIAWMWTKADEVFPPKGIYYVRSLQADWSRWSYPRVIVEGPYRYPDLAAVGKEQVLLVWSGSAEDRFKFSQWSSNNGQTWSSIYKFSKLGGYQGYSGIAVDSLGRLHLGMVATDFDIQKGGQHYRNDALIHSVWDGQEWSEPEVLMENTCSVQNLQYADIAISEGNIAHLVLMYPVNYSVKPDSSTKSYHFDIFYVRGIIDAPHINPMPILQTELLAATATIVAENKYVLQESDPSNRSIPPLNQPVITNDLSPFQSLVIGAIPIGILLILYVVIRKWIKY